MDWDLEKDFNLPRNKDGKYVINDEYIKKQLENTADGITGAGELNVSFILEGLCGMDVSEFDMSDLSLENFRLLTFDSETTFSEEQIEKFHPDKIIEEGIGFHGTESLYNEGINGEGTTIAMMDTCFNSSIEEYEGKIIEHKVIEKVNGQVVIRDYEEKDGNNHHGETTASFAAGKECGVAPNAKLILFGVKMDSWTDNKVAWEESEEAMLKHIKEETDKTEDGKFKTPDIISISADIKSTDEANQIKKELDEKGCTLIASKEFWKDFRWGRISDDGKTVVPHELTEIIFDDSKEYDEKSKVMELKKNKDVAIIPCTGRTCTKIGKNGNQEYKYNGSFCGASFAIPQIAGLFLLGRQIDPSIKYNEFIKILNNPNRINQRGERYVGVENLVEEIKERPLKEKSVLNSAIEATEENTRTGEIQNSSQNIRSVARENGNIAIEK